MNNDNIMRNYRIKLGLKQEQIANMINYTKSAYSLFEKGQRQPKASVILQLSNILHCPVDELIKHFANLEN